MDDKTFEAITDILRRHIQEQEKYIEEYESGNGSCKEVYDIVNESLPQYKEQLSKMEQFLTDKKKGETHV